LKVTIFLATHRPKLILREAYSPISDPLESKIAVIYTITNIGSSECWITECHLGLEFVTGTKYPQFMFTPGELFPNHVPYIGRIAAGEPKKLTFVDPAQVWDQDHRRDWGGTELGLHFVGQITYIDAPGSGIQRMMAFRRRYDTETQRFRRIWQDENEHEYAD
jgi:hypothetical protein